jgi:diacylglycerol kinase family enzyme
LTLEDPLAVVTLEHLDLRTLGPVASRALTSRDLSPKSGLDIQRNVRSIVIEADPPAPYQVDGDHLGSSKRLRFTWTPEHLSLVVPVDEA